MKTKTLQTYLSATFFTAVLISQGAQAGAHIPVDITKVVCVSRINGAATSGDIQDLVNEATASLAETCEAQGGLSKLKSFSLAAEEKACGFGLEAYRYSLAAECYVP